MTTTVAAISETVQALPAREPKVYKLAGSPIRRKSPHPSRRRLRDYARLISALQLSSPWLYCVLTFSRIGSPSTAYWALGKHYKNGRVEKGSWERLTKRLERSLGKFKYVVSVEEVGGWPHLNILFHFPAGQGLEHVRSTLKSTAPYCGFGTDVYLEPVNHPSGLAWYVTKLSQFPDHAPGKFRRIRASRGLLPKSKADFERMYMAKRWRELNEESVPAVPRPPSGSVS